MAYDGSLIFDTKIDTKGFSSGTNTIKSQANSLKSTFISLGKVIAGAFVLKKSVDIGKQALDLASDLQEVQNVVDVAFGEMSYKMEEFAKTSIETFGLSELSAKKTASSFMAMAKGMKFPADAASDMAIQLTALSADMASFFNITQDEARTALASVYTGETETLKRYGILITEVNLQEYARQQGIKKSIEKMTQQEKVMLRYNYIMSTTAQAQGDFARTSDSWANQTKILKERWKEFLVIMGNGLIQVLTPAMRFLNSAMTYMIALAKAVGEVLSSVFGLNIQIANSSQNVSSGAADAADNVTAIGDAAEEAGEKAAKAVAPFDKLNMAANAEVTGGVGQSIDSINTPDLYDAGGALGTINSNIGNIDSKVRDMVEKIKPILQDVVELFGKIKPLIEGIAAAFITYKVVDWFSKLGDAIGKFHLTPAGVIAVAIGAFIAVGSALKDLRDDAADAELEKRFGDIQLSIEDVMRIAQELTDSEYGAKIEIYMEEKTKLDSMKTAIQTSIDELNKLNWKVSVGLKLTEDEKEQYRTAIDSFVKNSNDYITHQQYVVSLAIDVAITENAEFAAEMKTMADSYYKASRTQLENLGTKLRKAMDDALADGVLDAEESKLITNIQKEMSEVLERTADAEFTAKLQMLTVDGDLTADSFADLTEQVAKIAEERINKATEAEFTTRAVIVANYKMNMENATTQTERDKLTKEYEADLAELTKEFSKTKATITLDGLDFSLGTLSDKFSMETKEIADIFDEDLSRTIEGELIKGDTKYITALERLANNIEMQMQTGINGIDVDSRLAMEKMFKSMKPTQEQLQKLHDEALKAGTEVPRGVSEGLTDIALLGAIGGDMDSINYLMGQKLSTDKTFIDALKKSETAGKDLDAALIAGLKSKIPDLRLAGDKLITETDGAIKKAARNSADNHISGYVGGMIIAAKNAFEKDTSTKKAVEKWLGGISDTVKTFQLPTMEVKIGVNTSALEAFRKGSQAAGIYVPGYASGTVVPANYGNFLAVLGDNKREPEVVSPVSAIEEAVENVMNRRGGTGGSYTFIAQLNGKTIYEETVTQDQMQKKSTGKSKLGN